MTALTMGALEHQTRLAVLRSALKECEFQSTDSAWWINYQRDRGNAPAVGRIARYLAYVKLASRWSEELAQLTSGNANGLGGEWQ